MKKILDSLKVQVKGVLQTSIITWHQSFLGSENDIEDLKKILACVQNKTITFKSDNECNDKAAGNQLAPCEDSQKELPKKRGRKTKTSSVSSEPRGRSDSSDCKSLNDSTASTSSSRSRRAAAQAAEHKLARVQSLVQLNTKLRRPTNFDEKQAKPTSSPPTKCRRTRRNQSAGSSSSQADEVNNEICREETKNMMTVENGNFIDNNERFECMVNITKLNTPTIEALSHPKSRSSRSLDRAAKNKSGDLFNDSIPLSEIKNKLEAPNSDPTHKTKGKKSILKKDRDSGISSTQEELQQLIKGNLPIAHSSPLSIGGEFKGFDDHIRQAVLAQENTFVVSVKNEETEVLLQKTLQMENKGGSSEEMEETETLIKTKTKVLKKKGNNATINVKEKENFSRNNETYTCTSKLDDSLNVRYQNKVLKEVTDQNVKSSQYDEKDPEEESESQSSPETNIRSRTKTIRKHNDKPLDDVEVGGQSLRSRTKTIKKVTEKDSQSDSTDNETNNMRSRTKTIKKGTVDPQKNQQESENLIDHFRDNLPSSKDSRPPLSSPAPAKGELVKKRIEDFEKMQNGMEECEEEKTVGRMTRNAMKTKVAASAMEAPSAKQLRKMMQSPASLKKTNSVLKVKDKVKEEKENMPVAKLQASGVKQPMSTERPRMTPLGVNNRMTPSSESAHKSQVNKWANSANRPAPVETTSVALIQKQTTEETERKRKEEERLKRQAKEEEAKKKKEKVLKATAEEARRKRMEKLQKVAAAREAAEKEKERQAAKAEKEKEEKMRQAAIEKEKQKEEQLKKKQLMQQKTLEHEERRKQEELARLAKLKEQEEEHKRAQALKEREQELQKLQKAEQRLAEAEKNKQQGGKLGKIAALNNAKLKMQNGVTPADKTNGAQTSNCYEITPCRDERPLLPPKTENDYGIDDAHSEDSSDDESRPKKMIPVWAQSKNRERLLMVNQYIPKKLWNMFMECDPCPDINKMFAGNPIKRRIRTSSAVWRTPPKYSRIAP